MEFIIRSKDSYPIFIDTEYVHINSIIQNMQYIAIFSDIYYLHKDGFIRSGIGGNHLDNGYWDSKEAAEKFYSEWKDRDLKIEILLSEIN